MYLSLFVSPMYSSWFFDAPLSPLGLKQVDDLHTFLNSSNKNAKSQKVDELFDQNGIKHISILRADTGAPRSKLIASNLRRAVSTMVGAFHERLQRHNKNNINLTMTENMDKILVVPSLQEISSNPDTLSITPPHSTIQASWLEQQITRINYQTIFNTQIDMSLHTGNKPINTNGLKRIYEFCEFIFTSGSIQEDYIIIGGHSLWFRSFFRLLLPYHISHIAKEKKIVNGGIIVFDLLMKNEQGRSIYMIDPQSIQTIYGGF
jgi:hypothetical protein